MFVSHYSRGVKNVTVTMEEDVARWARIEAAKREMSLARFVAALLRERTDADRVYDLAMRAYLSTKSAGDSQGRGLPSREEIHERSTFRR